MARPNTVVRTLEVTLDDETLSFKYDGDQLTLFFGSGHYVIPYEQRNALSSFLLESKLPIPDTEEEKV